MGWSEFNRKKIIDHIVYKKKNNLKFGISYLDDGFCGIEPTDLITLSAYSGAGKTELACHIAGHNARSGVKVHYFALEAEPQEVQMRMAYKIAVNRFFLDKNRPRINVRYKLYAKGLIDSGFDQYADFGEKEAEKIYKNNFKIFYREHSNFGIKEFEKELDSIDTESQLIIIDHLHYFDYGVEREYAALTNIMKKIRDLTLIYKIPIILVTQLNRPNKILKKVIPDLDDIHGSSNLSKICTKAIFIANNRDVPFRDDKLSPSLIRIAKFREEGNIRQYVGLINYNIEKNTYNEKYDIGILKNFDSEYELLEKNKIPYWCKNARI